MPRREPVAFGEPLEQRGRDRLGECRATVFELSGRAPFRPSQTPNSSIMRSTCERRERRPHPVQRMGERVHEAAFAQEVDELVDRRAIALKVTVVLLAQVPDEHVQRNVVLGEPGRDLDRQERAGPVGDAQRALDRVVVRDRDEGHAAPETRLVQQLRRRVRLAEPRPPERVVPAVGRADGMNVQITGGNACSSRAPSLAVYTRPARIPSPGRHSDTNLLPAAHNVGRAALDTLKVKQCASSS